VGLVRHAGTVTRTLTLLTINGHPDDESTTCGGIMARYAAEGVRVVCVVATCGEVGQIVATDLDTPHNRAHLGVLRRGELERALARLGTIELQLLGYRDSGMMGTPANDDPRSLWRADLDEAAGRLVGIVRAVRADVIVGPNAFGGDGHPDHIRAAELARLAYERAGDPDADPRQPGDVGPGPWAPAKLYETVRDLGHGRKLVRALAHGGPRGLASIVFRVARHWSPRVARQHRRMIAAQGPVTTRVDVRSYLAARYAAMAEHRTQIAPDSAELALTAEQRRRINPMESFTLVASRVPTVVPEDDLFAGLR
jgi:N-acetyl-1-D-myo-inositol-2-amino-2-deoxy-alpha-D-glucopyranoside deacetylase